MTKEEKINLMYETILKEFEKIYKKLDGLHHGKMQNDPGSSSEELGELRELIYKLGSVKIPVYKPEMGKVIEKLDKIMNLLSVQNTDPEKCEDNLKKGNSSSALTDSTILFNYNWLNLAFIFLFLASLGFNFFMFQDISRYRQSHLKYKFLHYSGNEEYLNELDSIWQIDSLRKQRISFITQRRKEIESKDITDHNLDAGTDKINVNKPGN